MMGISTIEEKLLQRDADCTGCNHEDSIDWIGCYMFEDRSYCHMKRLNRNVFHKRSANDMDARKTD